MPLRRASRGEDRRPHFIVDASAFVPFFFPDSKPEDRHARAVIVDLLKRREAHEVLPHIPDFCMAECSKAFARLAFGRLRDPDDARNLYRQKVDALLDIVSSTRAGLIRRLGLTRKHLVDIEEIFLAEYALNPRHGDRLSGHDALIIAMAKHHARHFAAVPVYILTGDAWLAEVCRRNAAELPRAINTYAERLPR